MEILWIIAVITIVSAITGALATQMIDSAMDYGHLLGFIRKGMADRIVKKTQNKELEEEWSRIKSIDHFPDRIEKSVEFYWALATYGKSFTGWICAMCLGFRVTTIIVVLLSIYVMNYVTPLALVDVLLIECLSVPIANFLITKIYR